ncbi:MAG: hypothetical protein J6K25_07345 [Thermoguttaceae bacterium]|nr:hypothetical protein [Thermoguttaceae bacterium]
MTQQKLFYRKVFYIAMIAVLVFPLYMLGNPARRDGAGGLLAQRRDELNLSEANLGEIDPAGSAMKLATFGMRGVAVSLLWNRSLEYEKRSDWDAVVATANQITMLEPHFITIWDFVGWKLAYNASAQFDDYRERYRWVIRGFEFVQEGTTYNQESPKLYVRAGWTISQKIGIADEKKQYRRLFREDEELEKNQREREARYVNIPKLPSAKDNWLFGHAFYKAAETWFEKRGEGIGNETRLLFYGRAPLNRIRYAEWMEIDGCGLNKENAPVFDEENCANAWLQAQKDWEEYANRVVDTTIEDKTNPGSYRRTSLNLHKEKRAEMDRLEEEIIAALPAKLGATAQEKREAIVWERWHTILNDEQRAAMYNSVLYPFDEKDYNLGRVGFGARAVRKYLDAEVARAKEAEEKGEKVELWTGPIDEYWKLSDEEKKGTSPWINWQTDLFELRMSFVDEDLRELARTPRLLVPQESSKRYSGAFGRLDEWQGRASSLLAVTPDVLASYLEGDAQAEAMDKIAQIEELRKEESFSRMFRDIMGADFHEREVAFEQTPEARNARKYRQEARDRFNEGDDAAANEAFLNSFEEWRKLLEDREDFADLKYLPQMQSEMLAELEKYVIVLNQRDAAFPAEYAFQNVARREDVVVERLRRSKEAAEYLRKLAADGKNAEARDGAETLLRAWTYFMVDNPIYALAPLPETTEAVFETARFYAETWDKATEAEREAARQEGKFADYPAKDFIELVLQKQNPDYQEIQRLEMGRLTDESKTFENLEKEIALWTKIVEAAPMLKYDSTSDVSFEIQNCVREYLLELKKREQPEPDDFPLQAFADAEE